MTISTLHDITIRF